MLHRPVLLSEAINSLNLQSNSICLDGTAGTGGFALEICARIPEGKLIALDLDPGLQPVLKNRLQNYKNVLILNDGFENIEVVMKKAGINSLNAAVLDLGLSSFALEDPGRGLSHRFSAPLDMRFNPISDKLTAAQAIEGLSLEELARVLKRFGEQPSSRKIATRIKAERPNTTGQLAKIIVSLVPASDREKSLARVFQALRIYVNRELERLSLFLKTVPHIMSSGGRLAIISYHSLEDRMVKEFLQRESKDCICPPHFPVCQCLHQATFKIITAKPIRPTEGEITQNPRARSARLRVGERL